MMITQTLNTDISTALQVLEQIQENVQLSNDNKLKAQTKDDLNLLISTLQNPILRSIITIQGSLTDLDKQLQEHPSILPADFDINESGELEFLTNQHSIYDNEYQPLVNDFDDQRVPVARLLTSHKEPSTQVNTVINNGFSPKLDFEHVINEASLRREVFHVKLFKPDGNSLGFSVIGVTTKQKSEIGIFIQEITPNGIAGRDGRLHEGDQILAIDGQDLDSNVNHDQAIIILQQARGMVELTIARDIAGNNYNNNNDIHLHSPTPLSEIPKASSDMVLTSDWAQVEVIDLINDGSGLGFGIVGGKSTGVVVKTIVPTGVADRDGRLQSGDHILQIGAVNLRGMGSDQAASVLRQCGCHVRIVVARPVGNTNGTGIGEYDQSPMTDLVPIVPSTIIADAEELNRYLILNGYPEITEGPVDETSSILEEQFVGSNDPTSTNVDINLNGENSNTIREFPILTMDMIPANALTNLPEMEQFSVELVKNDVGLGITIAGYTCEPGELSGVFVKEFIEGGPAESSGAIQVNDRIVSVDGISLQDLNNHEAVEMLKKTGQVVNLHLERYLRGPKYEQLQKAIAKCEEDNDDYESPISPEVETALRAKWSNILGPEYEIIVGQTSKFSDNSGLGISLEGTVDVVDGAEIKPHHYIRSILPSGPIGQRTSLEPGDELLEVNGFCLLNMNHSEVVKTLKDLPKNFRIVCCRNKNYVPPIQVINTSPEKDTLAARNILGGSLNNLIPGTDRLVKAKSDGSLASTGTTNIVTDNNLSKLKSRSLEPLTALARWKSECQIVELVKGERGLGFSVLDYQDPLNPNGTVIIIRSLVPGGVAQQDGRIIPGDRLLSVNDTILEDATLDQAVQVLKGAPKGIVRIGVAEPLQQNTDGLSINQAVETNKSASPLPSNITLTDSNVDMYSNVSKDVTSDHLSDIIKSDSS